MDRWGTHCFQHARPTPHAAGAFTLVELLTVVAIVSILFGLLLPTLGTTRESARQAVCAATQRDLAAGLLRYAADNEEWIPGFNTSGRSLWPSASAQAVAALSRHAEAPVQVNDWISPALAHEGLPRNREARFHAILENFACPEMNLRAPVWPGGDAGARAMEDWLEFKDVEPAHGISYMMPTNFMLYAPPASPRPTPYVTQFSSTKFQELARICTIRRDYRPRVDSIGLLSRKIALADGFRYLDARTVDFDASYSHLNWGSFTERSAIDQTSRSWGRRGAGGTGRNIPVVYRHSDRMNAAFWDGHVEPLGVRASHHPGLWAPSKSMLRNHPTIEPDVRAFGFDPANPARALID